MCWEECQCENRDGVTTCAFDNTCVSFDCNPPLRWTGVGEECIADECVHDHLYVSDEENYSCIKRCKCDGGKACILEKDCDNSTVTCITPYRKDPIMGGCMLEGCAQGTVQLNTLNPVKNGKCFMDCKCDMSKPKTEERCVYNEAGRCSHVSCNSGYTLVKASSKDPRNVQETGYKCVLEKKPASKAGVTAIVSIVMLIIGIAAGGGLMFFFEKRFQKKVKFAGYSNFGDDI